MPSHGCLPRHSPYASMELVVDRKSHRNRRLLHLDCCWAAVVHGATGPLVTSVHQAKLGCTDRLGPDTSTCQLHFLTAALVRDTSCDEAFLQHPFGRAAASIWAGCVVAAAACGASKTSRPITTRSDLSLPPIKLAKGCGGNARRLLTSFSMRRAGVSRSCSRRAATQWRRRAVSMQRSAI